MEDRNRPFPPVDPFRQELCPVAMISNIDVPVSSPSDITKARQASVKVATFYSLDETAKGRIAFVVTELGENLLRHAGGGRLIIGCHAIREGCQLEVLSIDHGPGMSDLKPSARGSSLERRDASGGLSAVQNLSTDFGLFSVAGRGSIVLSRLWVPSMDASALSPSSRFAHSAVSLLTPGGDGSGDIWHIRLDAHKATVLLADGVGEGTAAADDLIGEFGRSLGEPGLTFERLWQDLPEASGAGLVVAALDSAEGTIDFRSGGTARGQLVSQKLLMELRPGAVPSIDDASNEGRISWPAQSVVVLHTDGLDMEWNLKGADGLLQCDPAIIAGWLIRDFASGKDDATVVVLKRS